MVVSNSAPSSNTLKFDDFGVILSEEMRRKSIGDTSGNALTMESRGRRGIEKRVWVITTSIENGISKSILGNIECWGLW